MDQIQQSISTSQVRDFHFSLARMVDISKLQTSLALFGLVVLGGQTGETRCLKRFSKI